MIGGGRLEERTMPAIVVDDEQTHQKSSSEHKQRRSQPPRNPYRHINEEPKAEIRNEGVAQLPNARSEEHTSELQSQSNLVCRLLLEKKKKQAIDTQHSTDVMSQTCA